MLGTTRPGYDWQPPTKLALSGIDDIALGYRHACAVVRRPARVRCWGAVPGGTGESEVPQDVALPEALANAGIDYVSLGRAHSCLLSLKATPSRVWCWGRNERGQVGAGGSVSPQPLPVEGLTDATRLSAGDDHTCVVLERGSIKCWGRSDFYQAGSTSRNDAGNVTVPTEIAAPPGDHFVEVRAGDTAEAYPAYPGYTCARTEQRKIYCWGSDAGGRLAQGGALPQPDCDRDAGGLPDATGHEARGACKVPVVVTGIVDAEELRAGGGHACLRRGGSVLCWGHNGGGQLGTGIRSDAVETPAPVKGPDGGQFAAGGPMELGTFHTCTRNGTEVWCWGIGRFDGPDASPLNDSPIRMKLP
jgi:alpha-tubulin suppressor-like RCC1 family protein